MGLDLTPRAFGAFDFYAFTLLEICIRYLQALSREVTPVFGMFWLAA